jgi:general secretion pathway protein H
MTLIEVLIVVALMAMIGGALIFGSGMFSSSRQRGAASLVVSMVRLATTRANTSGRPVRIVFDLEQEKIFLEESSAKMLREKSDTAKPSAGAEPATEAEEAAQKEAEQILEGPTAPRARFSPVQQIGAEGRELGKGVEYRQVQTQHDREPVNEGRAYLYFWPGGGTERAAIQLQRKGVSDEDASLTVMVSPLTGRAKIQRGRLELPESLGDDDEGGEREEP